MTRNALAHQTIGSGDNTVVFVHGFTQTGDSWRPFIEVLLPQLANTKAILVDLPGHGASADLRLDLRNTAEALVATGGRATYVGYSLGARVMLHAALAHANLVERCVLISGTAGIDDEIERRARRNADEQLAERIEQIGTAAFIDEWLAQPLFAHLTPSQAQRAERLVNSPIGLASSLRLCGTGTQTPLWNRLAALSQPLLVVAGARDEKFVALARRMTELAPHARLEIIADAGHSAHLEQPTTLAGAFAHWITSPRT